MYTPIETYWCGGRRAEMAALLQELIPFEGECDASTPKLEKFRKAANAYYDLYNNGVKTAFCRIFGVSGKRTENQFRWNQHILNKTVRGINSFNPSDFEALIKSETTMDRLVMEAAEEAGFLR